MNVLVSLNGNRNGEALLLLKKRQLDLLLLLIIICRVVVPRSATVRDFIQQAVRNIRKTLEKKEVKYSEDSLQNLQFFVGPDNMCPHHGITFDVNLMVQSIYTQICEVSTNCQSASLYVDLSMLELERRFKGDDEVVRMKFGTTN